MTQTEDEYRDAFMHGIEFVLLGLQGRLAAGGLPANERSAVAAALADYERMLSAHQQRDPQRPRRYVSEAPILN